MDCHKILGLLLNEDITAKFKEKKLRTTLDAIYSNLPNSVMIKIKEEKNNVIESTDIRWEYFHLISFTIQSLLDKFIVEKNFTLSNTQFQNVEKAMKVMSSIGILPLLMFKSKLYSVIEFSMKPTSYSIDIDILQNYRLLAHAIDLFLNCFNVNTLKIFLNNQMDILICLIGGLLQLSYAPLKKPINQIKDGQEQFSMTHKLYNRLHYEQKQFGIKFHNFMNHCCQPLLFKGLMILNGCINNNPKWLQGIIQQLLSDRIVIPGGIIALALALCDDISDIGKSWNKLEIIARLVVTSHGKNKEKYYNFIYPQILEMLNSQNNRQKIIVSKFCIKAFYDYSPEVCSKNIIQPIISPFLIQNDNNKVYLEKTMEVSQSIEQLNILFNTLDSEFKSLPIELLTPISLPIFHLHVKSYQSTYVLRDQVKHLLLKILNENSSRESLYSVFLDIGPSNDKFGTKLSFQFSNDGGVEIISDYQSLEHEKVADCLFDLVKKSECLSFDLFTNLLKTLPIFDEINANTREKTLLETPSDTIERIEKHLAAMKLLTLLSSLGLVQKALLKNPEALLSFIKFYFSKITCKNYNFYNIDETNLLEQHTSILYTSLILIKIILKDTFILKNWKTFSDFIVLIKKDCDIELIPEQIMNLINEIESIIKKKGRSYLSCSYDLSIDNKNHKYFEKAIADLTDPLLPVQAHGLITLTKLIESRHPDVTEKKDFILCILQENLIHDDSFIYLAAINGLCAMSTMFPDAVIEILVQEFVGITQGTRKTEISPETRTKVGEILVKTTRALGEMAPKYKTLMVNAFLSGTRDSEPLVRASSLSCLGEFCKIMGFRLGNLITEVLYCIGCIIKSDKDNGCRRAGVLVATLLLQGLGKDALTSLGKNLVPLYQSLKYLRSNDKDPQLQLHAQLAIEEFDDIVRQFIFIKPKLEKSIFLFQNT